jgi:transposase
MARIKAKPVYTEEFRNEVLNMLRNSDRTIREVSLALGVSDWTLRTWYKLSEMARTSKKAKASPKPPPEGETPTEKIARLERELAASRKEVDSLRVDREILKKAAAFFAKESE